MQPRTDAGLLTMIGGYLLAVAFGFSLGIVIAIAGLAVATNSIFRGRSPGVLAVAVLVLASAGSIWFIASSNRSSDPPSSESATAFAEEYRAALADTDIDAYTRFSNPQLGVTLEDAFVAESWCLDWQIAQTSVAMDEISAVMAVATFTANDVVVVRLLEYHPSTGDWTVTVATDC